MRDAAPRYFWERPHEYEGKIIHVGTPGIFHRRNPDALGATYCGRPIIDARSTDHKLLNYSPCVVCFAKKEPASTARLMLAREMWARYHDVDGYSAWDEDSLPTHVYERWIERADDAIREAMARGD